MFILIKSRLKWVLYFYSTLKKQSSRHYRYIYAHMYSLFSIVCSNILYYWLYFYYKLNSVLEFFGKKSNISFYYNIRISFTILYLKDWTIVYAVTRFTVFISIYTSHDIYLFANSFVKNAYDMENNDKWKRWYTHNDHLLTFRQRQQHLNIIDNIIIHVVARKHFIKILQ